MKLSKLKWLYYRWQSMIHPWEELYRLKQIFQLFVIDYLESRRGIERPDNFVFNDKSDIKYTIKGLQKHFNPDYKWENLSFYDVCVEDIHVFSEWRKDPKSNTTSRVSFSTKIGNQNYEEIGDYRYVSVLSRFHHFPFFAIKALREPTLIKNLSRQISDWNSQNPYLQSIHWKSGIEAGIRVTNLLVTRKIISLLPKSVSQLVLFKLIDETIYKHYNFLKKHLSLYSSANNHLIAELLGLCTICIHYDFPNAKRETKKYFDFAFKAYLEQSYNDGFSKEQSLHYHAEVLGMLAIILNYIKDKNEQFSLHKEVLERYDKGIDILQYFTNWSLDTPHIGDSDDGQLIFPYADKSFDLYKSLTVDNQLLKKYDVNKVDIRNYLNFGERSTNKQSSVVPKLIKSKLFKDSGYCFFYENDKKLIFDIGELGLSPLAAHGHSDALQILLAYNDEPFIVDTGTYQYHARYEKWRKYFRSTRAHNTITINGKDQSRQVGRMNWRENFKSKVENFNNNSTIITCSATHDGFSKQGLKGKHHRTVTFHKKLEFFEILDTINETSEVVIDFNLHFSPQIRPELKGSRLVLNGEKGIVILENSFFQNATLVRGVEKPKIYGWYSSKFSKIKPIYSLNFSKKISKNTLIKTIITFKNIEV